VETTFARDIEVSRRLRAEVERDYLIKTSSEPVREVLRLQRRIVVLEKVVAKRKTQWHALAAHLRVGSEVVEAARALVTACDAGGDIPQPEFAQLWAAIDDYDALV
jgi:hypothetical protein